MTAESEPSAEFIRADGDGVCMRIDPSVYGDRPVLEALHRFTGRCHVHVEREPDGRLICRVVPKVGAADGRALAGELANELLDPCVSG